MIPTPVNVIAEVWFALRKFFLLVWFTVLCLGACAAVGMILVGLWGLVVGR